MVYVLRMWFVCSKVYVSVLFGLTLPKLCDFDVFFFFKQKTAYEMRISDWSSDVCSSDLTNLVQPGLLACPHCRSDAGRRSHARRLRQRVPAERPLYWPNRDLDRRRRPRARRQEWLSRLGP